MQQPQDPTLFTQQLNINAQQANIAMAHQAQINAHHEAMAKELSVPAASCTSVLLLVLLAWRAIRSQEKVTAMRTKRRLDNLNQTRPSTE